MAILKCKMCGGNLEITEGMSVCECEYCGSKQTVPSVDNEKKITLFTRANRLRSVCEFDKAFGVYESIVTEFQEEAEAYWGLLLCKYGIEYVDDPKTGNKIPTCHRSSFNSIMEDSDFEMVMEYSDSLSRSVYREEAKAIEELRIRINEVSSKEDPYDIFICYKETTEDGQRTIDSVIAQDVYDVLTEIGYKVFFSRITLEDKLGQEYEPYIFAALNSAKVMLVFGTNYEYYNAVWVKNEWSRFLSLIEKGEKKTLIPCYKDIDAYDIPQEFKRLQAQDMGKIGALQDLLRGIEKIVPISKSNKEITTVVKDAYSNTTAFIQRIKMFIEDAEWNKAEEYCEKVLDEEPHNSEIYYFKLLIDYKAQTADSLKLIEGSFVENKNYKKLKEYGSEELLSRIEEIVRDIDNRDKEIDEIARVINGKIRNNERVDSNNEEIAALEKKFKGASEQLNWWKASTANITYINSLYSERKKLGILGFKRKKEIDQELERLCAYRLQGALKRDVSDVRMLDEEQIQEAISESIVRYEKLIGDIRNQIYNLESEKQSLLNQEDLGMSYEDACRILNNNLYKKLFEKKYPKLAFYFSNSSVKIGDKLSFGIYQDSQIIWRILDIQNGKMLLITENALETKAFNIKRGDITWETCSLRKWLNGEFLKKAFDESQQSVILKTEVKAEKNPKYDTSAGNNTYDNVFLLSIGEAGRYFKSDEERKLLPSEYVKSIIKNTKEDEKYCWWWLRNVSLGDVVSVVDTLGRHRAFEFPCNFGADQFCVRPAMWVEFGI